MREIKFKVWDKIDKKILYEKDADKQGDFPVLLAVGFHGLPIAIDKDSFRDNEIIGWNRDHNLVLMQYTCLKDKNGKEIYEGDIVEYDHNIPSQPDAKERYIVEWGQGGFYFKSLVDNEYNSDPTLEVEIIGNIYENPELVEAS